jgi:hypothetical protein
MRKPLLAGVAALLMAPAAWAQVAAPDSGASRPASEPSAQQQCDNLSSADERSRCRNQAQTNGPAQGTGGPPGSAPSSGATSGGSPGSALPGNNNSGPPPGLGPAPGAAGDAPRRQ